MAAALVSLSAAVAEEIRPRGSKGAWAWSDNVASTYFEHGIGLAVVFMPEQGCHDAFFAISGNDTLDSLSFTIDGAPYNPVAVDPFYVGEGLPLAGFLLSKQALYDLKNGSVLRIDSNVGSLSASLSGSALAFNHAYGNCMRMGTTQVLQPTPPQASRPLVGSIARDTTSKLSSFETDDGAPVVVFEGDFEQGDSQAIIEALRNSGTSLLVLESAGGLVSEAQMVGYYLRSNNVNAMAGELCASACTFALAGGVERLALSTSRIGLHRSQLLGGGGSLEDGQQVAANYLRYFRSMGVDPELVAIAGSVSSGNMRWLSSTEAERLGLVTVTVPPE
ncbi:hypothetical protein F2Q65_17380 [Thiohalocapsa marina]|uniref:Uncharacterized protein n=1 Tax=Thiohalocapsa marina TaxID=424902 RepID=A0A5M8FEB8_9GAMM|nr:hypothetical protein [Thiohalocapsa marina]KAA6182744.1 hypothetical protein F2Q65_17380 [Thiohalocapsa marina]